MSEEGKVLVRCMRANSAGERCRLDAGHKGKCDLPIVYEYVHDWQDIPGFTAGTKKACGRCGATWYPFVEEERPAQCEEARDDAGKRRSYVRYGRHDNKAHYVRFDWEAGPSYCGLSADDMEDGIQVAYVCERCYELAEQDSDEEETDQ